MKKFFKIFALVIVLLIGGCSAFFFAGSSGLNSAANDFFVLVSQDKLQEAYDSTSTAFQKSASLDVFEDFINQRQPFKDYASFSVHSWERETGEPASAEGTLTTTSGETYEINFNFVKEEGDWKVFNLDIERDQDSSGVKGAVMPSDAEIGTLTHATMTLFVDAIDNKSFQAFHDDTSKIWQAQITPAELLAAFLAFTEKDYGLSEVKGLSPIFNEVPTLNDDNILILKGSYPTSKFTTHFELEYIFELPEWKLTSIDVNI